MDSRYTMTRDEYRMERAALVAEVLDIRSGKYGEMTETYLYGNRTACTRIRSVFYARRNARNRKP